MSKSMTSNFKRIISVALAMMLCLSIALPGMADEPQGAVEAVDEDHPAEAAITKVFEMPIGTDTPEVAFNFIVEKVMVDGGDDEEDFAKMPTIGTDGVITVTFNGDLGDGGIDETGIKTIKWQSAPFFAGATWKHAGVYVYKVTEEQDNNTIQAGENGIKDKLEYSLAEYRLEVLVKELSDGSGYYVHTIAAKIIIQDDTKEEKGGEGKKVDPTPGDKSDYDNFSGMIFTNKYLTNNGGEEPKNPGDVNKFSVLNISKEVDNDEGVIDTGRYFNFDITLTDAAVIVKDGKYKAYILEEINGNLVIVTDAENFGAFDTDGSIKFEHDKKLTVSLKHGQRLAFIDMPVGTYFMVNEQATNSYTPSYKLTVGTTDKLQGTAATSTSLALSTAQYINEASSLLAYINEYNLTLPTGISVDNLPYVVMIGAAMFALAGLTVLKYRRGSKNKA